MEKHFLDDLVTGKPIFRAEAWYNELADAYQFKNIDHAPIAHAVDHFLTLYTSSVNSQPIGFSLRDVSEFRPSEITSDAYGMTNLLLSAYEHGPLLNSRREKYATAIATLYEKQPNLNIKG